MSDFISPSAALYPVICANTNIITDFHAILQRSSPSPPVKHTCGESYRRIGDKTKLVLRRVLQRVFRPRPHRLHTMNGGVYEPLAVPIARSYPITTVQYNVLSQVGSSRGFGAQKLPGAPNAASNRQPESATNWIQHHAKCHDGDCIDEDNCK